MATRNIDRSDAIRRLNAASRWVEQYRPMTADEVSVAIATELAQAETLRRQIDGEPRNPVSMAQTREERVCAYRDYIAGGWQTHYAALRESRREAALTEMAAQKCEGRAAALAIVGQDRARAWIETLAHELAYARYHIAALRGTYERDHDYYRPLLSHLLEIGVDAARVEARRQIEDMRAALRAGAR